MLIRRFLFMSIFNRHVSLTDLTHWRFSTSLDPHSRQVTVPVLRTLLVRCEHPRCVPALVDARQPIRGAIPFHLLGLNYADWKDGTMMA